MQATLGWADPRKGGEIPGKPTVNGGVALVAAVVEGAGSPGSSLSVGLPTWEPLEGNWSSVKHLLEG